MFRIDNLPPLRGRQRFWSKLFTLIVVIGVTIGIFGAVRSGSIFVAIGCALYSYNSYTSTPAKRKVELIIPVVIALLLLVLSFTLPHAR
jgi:hypothetical protein